jgi:hypothetical protein
MRRLRVILDKQLSVISLSVCIFLSDLIKTLYLRSKKNVCNTEIKKGSVVLIHIFYKFVIYDF